MKNRINKKDIPISSGSVIISNREENSYDFVFSDIKSVQHLYISTFNYYMEKEYLDNILSNINKIRDIRVVFNAYDIETVIKIIKNSIKLNPYVQLYYNKNNHSKIISNGSHMYIGSANYTGYSKENYEVGVKINDEKAIHAIESEVFQHLFDYKVVVSDPIQPIITYFTVIHEEYAKAMDWIQWFFTEAQNGQVVTEDDIEDMDYTFIDDIFETFNTTMKKLKEFIKNNPDDFKEDGIALDNFIDIILEKIKCSSDINLGAYSKGLFSGFYEDYLHCMEQYKTEFWYESIIEMSDICIHFEREIITKIEQVLKMLLYLKIKWIKEFTGVYKQEFILCEESCFKWLLHSHYALDALDALI